MSPLLGPEIKDSEVDSDGQEIWKLHPESSSQGCVEIYTGVNVFQFLQLLCPAATVCPAWSRGHLAMRSFSYTNSPWLCYSLRCEVENYLDEASCDAASGQRQLEEAPSRSKK